MPRASTELLVSPRFMDYLNKFTNHFPLGAGEESAQTDLQTSFIYVKFPIVVDTGDTHLIRNENIDEMLKERGIGSIIGWGDSLGDMQANGLRPVAFHRVDIDVGDFTSVRALLHQVLPDFRAPVGTEIHYKLGGEDFQDVFSSSGWLLAQPSRKDRINRS